MHQAITRILICVAVLLSAGCNSGSAQLEAELLKAERRLTELESAINSGTLRNASIIKQYSQILRQDRPELSQLVTQLSREATLDNPIYLSLRERYKGVSDGTENFDSWVEKVEELQLIQTAADTAVFNDALSDTVNVMADLSNGKLARVNSVSREVEQQMNGTKDQAPGSQYVGNPHYGHWNHSSGGSFWAWYGQYAFFSSMFSGPRYYHDWAGGRGYSYYHDVGRNTYTSRSQRGAQADVQQRAQKQFGKGGFKSPYAKARTGATGISKASVAQQKSAFKSPYAKSSGSKVASSTRTSSSRTSRGTARGK